MSLSSDFATGVLPHQLHPDFVGADSDNVPALELKNVVRRYGAMRALDGVSFSIPKGALCGLIGPNGAGKTTLLSILATLDDTFEGEARICGESVRKRPLEARRLMGFVPDHARIYEGYTVEEMLQFFAHAEGIPKAKRAAAVDDALGLSGLLRMRTRPASGLSKGMTQRLCVARALLHDPEVLLLDEPASGLDPRARIELKQLLKALQRRKKTVFISSHILTELGDFCDTVVVIEKGKIVASGAIADLWGQMNAVNAAEGPRRVTLEVTDRGAEAAALVEAMAPVLEVHADGNVLSLLLDGSVDAVPRLIRTLVLNDFDLHQASPEKRNLEALFLTVTEGEVQ